MYRTVIRVMLINDRPNLQVIKRHVSRNNKTVLINAKENAIPVRGRGSRQGCETSRLPHLLHNLIIDGGEVVSLMRRPPHYPPTSGSLRSHISVRV
jgi:hypothetical protein